MTIDATPLANVDRAVLQIRVQRVLMSSLVLTGAAMSAVYAAAAVLAEDITGSDTLAGLAGGCLAVGSALATVPVARRMARLGRRRGLVAGWAIGALGAAIAFASAILEFYPFVVLGMIGIGAGNATNLAARYAAADLADDDKAARAIGLLVWTATIGTVVGPTLALGPAGAVAESVGLPQLSGPFLLAVILFLGGLACTHIWLRPDPLEVLGTIGDQAPARPPLVQTIQRIAASPAARLAVLAMLVGHAVMVGVMTMTPLHMKDGDHELRVIGFVISLHVVGMYAFSPAIGWLVDRLGPHLLIGAGGVALFLGAELASHTDPEDSMGVFVGLFLIGLGWSFGLIAGSSLLTKSFAPAERVHVQGTADLIMTSAGAAAGLSAGMIVEWAGFHSLSHWAGLGSLTLVAAALAAYFTGGSARPVAT